MPLLSSSTHPSYYHHLPFSPKTHFTNNNVCTTFFFNPHKFLTLPTYHYNSLYNNSNNTRINCLKSSIIMEGSNDTQLKAITLGSTQDKYTQELEVGIKAVQMACSLCQKVQDSLISKSSSLILQKDDNSLVTIADWSVQATVSWVLSESFGSQNVSIVAEEDVEALSKPEADGLLESVVKTVNECLAKAPQFGINGPITPLSKTEILEAIGQCNSIGGPSGRFWVLDPVDGTLGFVRGDQYAVALALVEDGEVVLGVLGCPNYPLRKEWLSYHHRYYRIISKLTPPTSESWDKGIVLYARKGSGKAWMQPLLPPSLNMLWLKCPRPVYVSCVEDPSMATFCEPVERANSSHSFTAGLAHSVGVRTVRINFPWRTQMQTSFLFFSSHLEK